MARTIKFRIWEVPTKKFHYDIDELFKNPSVIPSKILNGEDGLLIVQQCSDISDRYSNLIYEGDIVFSSDDEEFYEVVFYLGMFCVKHKNETYSPLYEYPEVQITGNIFDNHKLLS